MYTFITLLIVLISVLLILLVLIQKPKGGGLAQGFSSTNQIMGVKRTSDVVERGTWILSHSFGRKGAGGPGNSGPIRDS
jgi:preprotein translocase subunit SecG